MSKDFFRDMVKQIADVDTHIADDGLHSSEYLLARAQLVRRSSFLVWCSSFLRTILMLVSSIMIPKQP
jgi:hypothetical protein